ncbi:hypothetical protein DPMN_151465 [Dreissena polymorpha]|uniref:Uncharacterized protein n=1 Tax=Dreissena polymorpha TaxID=45954 RepID=A0A9D4FJJ9_DREPO|nr:hypothetical protein DPMN_151465 [Dreissena polymorpha]
MVFSLTAVLVGFTQTYIEQGVHSFSSPNGYTQLYIEHGVHTYSSPSGVHTVIHITAKS